MFNLHELCYNTRVVWCSENHRFVTKLVLKRRTLKRLLFDGLGTDYEVAIFVNDVSKPVN